MAAPWSTLPMDWTWLGPPLDVRPLFPVERGALVDLLDALGPDEWSRATVCPGWAVHDVAGHILHDYVRRLSAGRDGHPGPDFGPDETLAAFLTRTNEDFVRTARQISPRLMTDLLAHLGARLDAAWSSRQLSDPAGLDVSWAAPGVQAPLWLDIAREFSEFWVHQQQIRDAVGRPAPPNRNCSTLSSTRSCALFPRPCAGPRHRWARRSVYAYPAPPVVGGPRYATATAGPWPTTRPPWWQRKWRSTRTPCGGWPRAAYPYRQRAAGRQPTETRL